MRQCFSVTVFFTSLIYSAISIHNDDKIFVPAGKDMIDFDSNEDILKHERYARHVEVITESVVEHIVKELKTRFPEVSKRMPKDKLNQIGEDLNTMIRILKRRRIRTRNLQNLGEKNGTKRNSMFWKNKFMFTNT